MLAKLKATLILLGLSTTLVFAALPATTQATTFSNDACQGLTKLDSSQDCNSHGSAVNGVLSAVVEILSGVVGVAAVIMMIIAGFKYITSAGDSNNIASAKNTLIYALVGVIIAAVAQILVHYVINRTV